MSPIRSKLLLAALWAVCWRSVTVAWAAGGGELKLEIVDRDTAMPLVCRMHLYNAAKKPQLQKKLPNWHDHFIVDGAVTLKLNKGDYQFEIEHGLEYLTRSGQFHIDDFAADQKRFDLKRFANLASEGWYGGDLCLFRPADELPLLMQAEELQFAALLEWGDLPRGGAKNVLRSPPKEKPRSGNRPIDAAAKPPFAERWIARQAGLLGDGGRLLLLGGSRDSWPTEVSEAARGQPFLPALAHAPRQLPQWIDAAEAASWHLPIWLALGAVDSIGLASGVLERGGVGKTPDGCRVPDPVLFRGPRGWGRWSETIYYHVLSAGLRIPPSGSSWSGISRNPAGYNRTYVAIEGSPTVEAWWSAMKAGRVVVTNGPLLRPTVEGEPPGHVFFAPGGQSVELEIGLTLSTRDKIDYLEVVQDGRAVQNVRLDQWKQLGGKMPPVRFSASGWFVLRAVTELDHTYRFATSGPYYVEIGDRGRISRASVRFFLDWLDELEKIPGGAGKREPEALQAARQFWENRLAQATVN